MKDKPQIWLRAHARAPKDLVRAALVDTSSYRAWWSSPACSLERVDGTVDVGSWLVITSTSRNGRARTYSGQILEKKADSLTFSWRGRQPEAVRVTITLEASKDGETTQIDAKIAGVPSAKTAAGVGHEWSMILRILARAWGAAPVTAKQRAKA